MTDQKTKGHLSIKKTFIYKNKDQHTKVEKLYLWQHHVHQVVEGIVTKKVVEGITH